MSERCAYESTTCHLSGRPSRLHKLGHEPGGDDRWFIHNLTNYVCCRHFGELFGWLAVQWCADDHPQVGEPFDFASARAVGRTARQET